MKVKISNFPDFACIFPGVQQMIGIPIAGHHLVCVIHDLIQEIFYKKYVEDTNKDFDKTIYQAKINKLNCFLRLKNTSEIEQEKKEVLFDQNRYDGR